MSEGLGNLDDLLNQLKGITPSTSTEQTETTGSETVETPVTQTDSIQQAQQKDVEKGVQAPGQPLLLDPEVFRPARNDVEAFMLLFNSVEATVINAILDVWARGIEENKKANKEEIERAIRMGFDRIGQFAANYSSKEEAQVSGVSSTQLAVANLMGFTMMSAFAITQLSAAANPIALSNLHNLNPGIFGVVPPEMAEALAMTGALISAGLISPILLSLTGTAQATKGNLPKGALASQLAYATLQMVQSGVVRDVIAQDARFSALTGDQKSDLIARMNLSFLLSALTMFYEKETGWITEEELLNMISQGSLFEQIQKENPNDPRLALVAAIREELKGLSASNRDGVLADLVKHFSDNPSYESSREMYELLEKMWLNLDYEQMSENAA
ncbi:MAG: hypothetical protein K940chlam3_00892 [Chlamydiae bacterium]|nr:hypothetical protein [Chlamydiota bacterium]